MLARKGFTMLELLIASSLTALIGLALVTALFSGFKLWRWSNEQGRERLSLILGIEGLGQDVRQALTANNTWLGSTTTLEFVRATDQGLRKISYQFDPANRTFWRRESGWPPDDNQTANFTQRPAFSVDQLALSYLIGNGSAVSQQDNFTNQVPLMINFSAGLDNQSVNQTIFMPAGAPQ